MNAIYLHEKDGFTFLENVPEKPIQQEGEYNLPFEKKMRAYERALAECIEKRMVIENIEEFAFQHWGKWYKMPSAMPGEELKEGELYPWPGTYRIEEREIPTGGSGSTSYPTFEKVVNLIKPINNSISKTDAQQATLDGHPEINFDDVISCTKCDGSGETQPDVECKRCRGTGIQNIDDLISTPDERPLAVEGSKVVKIGIKDTDDLRTLFGKQTKEQCVTFGPDDNWTDEYVLWLEGYILNTKSEPVVSQDQERDTFALDFAVYMEEDRWKYDHAEQKTHSFEEHLNYFKAVYK